MVVNKEFLEEEKPDEIETKEYEREYELIENEAEKHHEEVEAEEHLERGSIPLSTWLQPPKRGRGRPVLLRSGLVERPRKLYHLVTNINEENDSEDSKVSNGEGLSEETSDDDDVFMECNLTVTHNPVTRQEAKQGDDVKV